MATTYVTHGRARLASECTGAGPDVLLVHAGVTDQRSWATVRERLGARCLSFDARGFGRTEYEPEDGWSPVSDAVAVLDAHEVGEVVVIGASMGGRASLDLALAHPDRVAGLVLIGSAISGAPGPTSGELDETTVALDGACDAALERGDLEEANRLEANLWLDGPHHPGRVEGAARELFLEMNAIALAAADPGDQDEPDPAWDRLREIACPALVMAGEYDLAHIRRNARHLAETIPAAELVELAGVAHLPHLEGDPATLRAISGFFAAG